MSGWPLPRATMLGCALIALLPTVFPGRAGAQVLQAARSDSGKRGVDAEFRVDAIVARVSAVQAGIGVTAVTGTYLRSGVVGAVGLSRHGLSGRIDAVARFHFDPFRQSRWAPYGGGGISGRFDRDEGAHAYLLVLLGLDGPLRHGMSPSFEVGLGGGARVGVIFRQATGERR